MSTLTCGEHVTCASYERLSFIWRAGEGSDGISGLWVLLNGLVFCGTIDYVGTYGECPRRSTRRF